MARPRSRPSPRPAAARPTRADATIASNREQMMGRLLGSILHEINNLLTPALTYCELSRESPADARLASDAARHAFDAIVGVRQVASTLLSLGRSGPTGEGRVAPLNQILEGVAGCAAPLARRRGVRLECVAASEEAGVECTPVQHIALNLLLNAINATPRGGTVRLSAAQSSGSPSTARAPGSTWNASSVVAGFCVEDAGHGLPAAARRLLEGRAVRGTSGLGLRVCAMLARSLHAKVEVERSPLGGGRVTVRVPIAAPMPHARRAA